jgi:hypothetical protein
MIVWTLTRAGGQSGTFEEWGIKTALDRRVALGRGTVELGFGRSDLLGSLPFDPAETVLISADGDPYFRGRVIGEKRGAYGSSETAVVTLADPWWYLEKIIFCRQMTVVADPASNPAAADPSGLQISDFVTTTKLASDIILSENESGSLTDSRAMIVDAVAYAVSKGAPIALGTVDAGLQIPREELHDVTCAELILKSLRWTPDQSAWWDYSANPPTLNVRTLANRALLSLDVNDGTLQRVEINPLHDSALTGVTLNYLRRHQRTNFEFVTLDDDTAGPNPLGIVALVTTIELYGSYIYQAPASGGSTPPAVVIQQEAAPAGLALSLYNAYKDLSFEGSVNLLAGEIETLYLGRTLRVLNGAPAWAIATMDIQAATIDLFAMNDSDGEHYAVELTVGPPRQLGPVDLVGLVRKGRTKSPPLIGGPGDGGSPRLPQFNYGNPDLPQASQHPDIILKFWYYQDAGFPNSWGPSDGQRARIKQTFASDPVLEEVNSATINDGQIHTVRGIRFLVVKVYFPRTTVSFPDIYVDAFIDDYFDPLGHRK